MQLKTGLFVDARVELLQVAAQSNDRTPFPGCSTKQIQTLKAKSTVIIYCHHLYGKQLTLRRNALRNIIRAIKYMYKAVLNSLLAFPEFIIGIRVFMREYFPPRKYWTW